MGMIINLDLNNKVNEVVISAYTQSREKICEYKYMHKGKCDTLGVNIAKTTLLGWAVIDLSKADKLLINTPMIDFEKDYLLNNYRYSVNIYEKIYDYKCAEIEMNRIVHEEYNDYDLQSGYYLGYSGGKDSTLCKVLLDETGANYVSYKVSYNEDKAEDDGQIFCNVINRELYADVALSELKENSEFVSCHQADDIHVTFAVPYILERYRHLDKLAVGIPWDAIHKFDDGCSELVPTETVYSILFFEELIRNYGFRKFKLISPIAALHTYGVYYTLSKIFSVEALLEMDSCWESYENKEKGCGYCPKCQRLKRVFKDCFNKKYLEEVPDLEIENSDFLFGSVYAKEILSIQTPHTVMASLLVDRESIMYSGEFLEVLFKKQYLTPISVKGFEYKMDGETWEEIRKRIYRTMHIDYSKLSDTEVNNCLVPYLPFEKSYKWNRNHKLLNCYDSFTYISRGVEKKVVLSDGPRNLALPDNDAFRRFTEINDKFNEAVKKAGK